MHANRKLRDVWCPDVGRPHKFYFRAAIERYLISAGQEIQDPLYRFAGLIEPERAPYAVDIDTRSKI